MKSDEHEHTLALAQVALGQIKALRQAADPRHYEVWYLYAAGLHPSLNQMLNEMLANKGELSDTDIDEIYATYIAPNRLNDRLATLNSKMIQEIEQIMSMVDAAAGSASKHTESLADMTHQLGHTQDRDGIRAIIKGLLKTAQEMEQNNHALEVRLSSSKQQINQLQKNLDTVRTESLTDPLTSLANRKYFDESIIRTIGEATNRNEPLSLMITDIDHFKSVNDTYGHLTGDQVLRLVAQSVKQNVKGRDVAARYGGEEFAVLLPDTALRQAMTVAEQIRRIVMSRDLMKRSTGEHLGRVTISIGVATLRPGDSAQTLIERADTCLYAAKRNGRNRVICESDPESNIPMQTRVA